MRQELTSDRERHRDRLRSAGIDPYPSWHGRTHTAQRIRETFGELSGKTVTVAGRVRSAREHGGVRFLDVADASGALQLLCRADLLSADHFSLLDAVDPGDVLSATGTVTKTHAGETSIDVSSWVPLSKALTPLPDLRSGLRDAEERARRREQDLLANPETKQVFLRRSKVMATLRDLLRQQEFLEVETPILQHQPGGAAARPFRTRHDALDLEVTLRIAPELFLKRLIVGGFEKIFEIGRVFRNEGVDRQHNPEFTMCELYQAYATVEDLIPFTESLIADLLTTVLGTTRLPYQGMELDFTPPWPKVSFVDAVERTTGVNVLEERTPKAYCEALRKLQVSPPADQSVPSLMDKLVTESVRKKATGPLILQDAPVELEPLAKRRADEPRLVQRMQLLAAGMELIKAYTEENDPVEQEARFRSQAELRGSSEIHPLDAEYVEALKVGLPPTAGWGLGVDRFAMLVTDQPSIQDVLFFPLMRPRSHA